MKKLISYTVTALLATVAISFAKSRTRTQS